MPSCEFNLLHYIMVEKGSEIVKRFFNKRNKNSNNGKDFCLHYKHLCGMILSVVAETPTRLGIKCESSRWGGYSSITDRNRRNTE